MDKDYKALKAKQLKQDYGFGQKIFSKQFAEVT